jgi:hypothetical protein
MSQRCQSRTREGGFVAYFRRRRLSDGRRLPPATEPRQKPRRYPTPPGWDRFAENQPELMARHCTEAGLIEKAVFLWGKAGQRSLARSALVEAAEQRSRLNAKSFAAQRPKRTENNSSGSSGGSPSASACSINRCAGSAAALVSGAAYPSSSWTAPQP